MNERKQWNGEAVRRWLESRFDSSRRDQDEADEHGRERQDDYDKAAAEEYVCQLTKNGSATESHAMFADALRTLLEKDDHRCSGVYDDRRFEREVRSYIRKLMKLTKANAGFENTSRYQ